MNIFKMWWITWHKRLKKSVSTICDLCLYRWWQTATWSEHGEMSVVSVYIVLGVSLPVVWEHWIIGTLPLRTLASTFKQVVAPWNWLQCFSTSCLHQQNSQCLWYILSIGVLSQIFCQMGGKCIFSHFKL